MFCLFATLLIALIAKSELLISSYTEISGYEKIAEYKGKYIYLMHDDDFTSFEHNNDVIVEQNSLVYINTPDADVDDVDSSDSDTDTPYGNEPVGSQLWNLDILDGSLNKVYTYDYTGKNVSVYVIDSGITNTPEFEGRVIKGISFVSGDSSVKDCLGHGTHVSSLIAGKTYGVAKDAKIVPVRVFGCQGSVAISTIIQAMYWVITQPKGIINMSLGGRMSTIMNSAARDLAEAGFIVVVAAGNDGTNACMYSPASESTAISVGCLTENSEVCYFSNEGACVSLFAAGYKILGLGMNGGGVLMSGTSMSSPGVAGAAAVFYEKYPGISQKTMKNLLITNSAKNTLSKIKIATSPNIALRIPVNATAPNCSSYSRLDCNKYPLCNFVKGYGCRIIGFCGYRTKRECKSKKKCKFAAGRCMVN